MQCAFQNIAAMLRIYQIKFSGGIKGIERSVIFPDFNGEMFFLGIR